MSLCVFVCTCLRVATGARRQHWKPCTHTHMPRRMHARTHACTHATFTSMTFCVQVSPSALLNQHFDSCFCCTTRCSSSSRQWVSMPCNLPLCTSFLVIGTWKQQMAPPHSSLCVGCRDETLPIRLAPLTLYEQNYIHGHGVEIIFISHFCLNIFIPA